MNYLQEQLHDTPVTIIVDEITMKNGITKATGKLVYSDIYQISTWASIQTKLMEVVNWLRDNDGY